MPEATFKPADFAAELAHAHENYAVGTGLLFENERIRVWEIVLAPSERAPFHHHRHDYFWVCTAPGQSTQRFTDGTMTQHSYEVGDTVFTACASRPVIHDLENSGSTLLRFVTTELLH